MRSDRFYWCTGCGEWHDPLKQTGIHYSMHWEQHEPDKKNFQGTAEELERFKIARQLKREDAEAFESRIDSRSR